MKKTKLLPVTLLCLLGLVACGGTTTSSPADSSDNPSNESSEVVESSEDVVSSVDVQSSEDAESSEEVSYGVTISNKDVLTADGWYNSASRTMEIALTPEGNVLYELKKGTLTITSDNPTVVSVSGVNLTANSEGTATITVDYHGETDTVTVTTAGEMGEPAHKVVTCADVLAELNADNQKTVVYDIQECYVVAFQSGKTDPTKYGNYYVADTLGETDQSKWLQIYGSSANAEITWEGTSYSVSAPSDFLTDNVTKDINLKSKLSLTVCGMMYGTTQEATGKVNSADNSACDKTEAQEPSVVENKSLTEFFADTQGNGKQAYIVKGKIVGYSAGKTDFTKYGNFYLTDPADKSENPTQYLIYGATATASALTWNGLNGGSYSFSNPQDFLTHDTTKDIKIGDVVTMKLVRCDYSKDGVTTLEGNGIVLSVEAGEGGQTEEIKEPEIIKDKKLADLFADTKGNGKQAYEVTGVVAAWKDDSAVDATKYGNFYLTDPDDKSENPTQYYVYGATATASALTWSTEVGVYGFKNPQDFLTNDTTKNLRIGDIVTMRLTRCDYTKGDNVTLEANGIVLSVEHKDGGETYPEPEVLKNKTLAELFADTQGNGKQAYEVTGVVAAWKNDTATDATAFGNFYLVDPSDTSETPTQYYVYGATATATALKWDAASGKYGFTNPKDFLTNDLTKDLQIGDTVTIRLTRCDYTNKDTSEVTLEANGIVLSVTPGEGHVADTSLFNATIAGGALPEGWTGTGEMFAKSYYALKKSGAYAQGINLFAGQAKIDVSVTGLCNGEVDSTCTIYGLNTAGEKIEGCSATYTPLSVNAQNQSAVDNNARVDTVTLSTDSAIITGICIELTVKGCNYVIKTIKVVAA